MLSRMRFVIIASIILGLLAGSPEQVRAADPGAAPPPVVKSVVRIDVSSAGNLALLKQTLRSWDVAGTVDAGRTLDLVVTAAEQEALRAAGLDFAVIVADLEASSAQERAVYHTFPQMESVLAGLAANYPAITQLFSIGTSWEGRNIWCLEVSDNPGSDEGEVGVVFMGLHHAREWPTVECCLEIATRLTSGYGTDPTITDMVNNRRIWIIPCVNADGYVWSHDQGHDWRKNRHPYGGDVGVDLNRNYDGTVNGNKDGEWGTIGSGSQSHNPSQETYVGPGPFSEPETQVVRDFFNARNVTISVSYHTYSELVLWPWGYGTSALTDDNALLVSLGQGMAALIGRQSGGTYTPQQSAALYPTTGASDDWIYGYRYYGLGKNTLAYTVEMAASFQPPVSQLQQVLNENWDGALYMLQQAAAVETQLVPFVLPPNLQAPVLDADGTFTLTWSQQNPDAGATHYGVQEYSGLTRVADGAESGTGRWTLQNFATSTTQKHTGTYSFKPTNSNSLTAAMTATAPLPVEAGDELTFWIWYDIEANWDMAFVEASRDGRQYDLLDKYTGSSGGTWVQKTYSLDAYVGGSVFLRFRYTTDTNTLGNGVYIDDIYPLANWAAATNLVASTPATALQVTGRADGDYYYRIRGMSAARGWGDYSVLERTRVYRGAADSNSDGDRDLLDFADFQRCFAGDGAALPADCPVTLAVFDLDVDGDVDLADLAIFADCLTGPDHGLTPACPF